MFEMIKFVSCKPLCGLLRTSPRKTYSDFVIESTSMHCTLYDMEVNYLPLLVIPFLSKYYKLP